MNKLNRPDIESIAAQVHSAWQTAAGKACPSDLLVPYHELSEPAKDLSRLLVILTYNALEAATTPMTKAQALGALTVLDHYARIAGLDTPEPRAVLERFIEERTA